jgi:hypothetical protein
MIPHYLSDLNATQWTRRLLALVLGVSLLLTVWSLSSYLWDRYRVVRDVQNFYWMALAQDPNLFATDYLHISSSYIVEVDILGFRLLLYPLSLGYALFFYLASTVIDYVWLTKLSVWVLVPLCVIYLFKLGKLLEDNLTGVSLGLIFVFFILASPLSISIVSGLQRAFAVPLFIAFLYYLIRQQYIGAGLLIFISSLVYLPSFPPMVLAYALSFVNLKRPFKLSLGVTRSQLMPLAVALLLSSFIVALALAVQLELLPTSTPTAFSSDTLEDVPVADNPVYQSQGSMSLFIGFPFLGRAGIFDTGGDAANFLVMLVFAFLIYKVVGPSSLQRMSGALWCLLAGSFIMYAVSLFFVFGLSSFALYLPSRYTRGTLFLGALFFAGLNWVDFFE